MKTRNGRAEYLTLMLSDALENSTARSLFCVYCILYSIFQDEHLLIFLTMLQGWSECLGLYMPYILLANPISIKQALTWSVEFDAWLDWF